MRRWALVIVAAFAAIPTPSLSWFDGLPIDRPLELLTFVLIVVLIASRRARRAAFHPLGAAGARAVALAAVAGATIKILLIAHGAQAGFIACYHGGITPASTRCDRSFDNPFDRFSATRIDPHIEFGGRDWRLGLLNSLRFNAIRRDDALLPPVPFSVEWTSVATSPSEQPLRLAYRGEASVAINGHVEAFPADYSTTGAFAAVTLPEGRHRVVIAYRFAPPNAPTAHPTITSAVMHLEAGTGVRWGTADRRDVVGGWAIDVLAVVVLGLLVAGIVAHAPRHAAMVGCVVGGALLVSVAPIPPFGRDKLLELLIIAGCLFWVWAEKAAIPLAIVALALLCVLRVGTGTGPAPGVADYRLRLDDGLMYESFAHTILDDRSPQGGENVFTVQIFFRYIRFAERMLFGEGDWLLVAAVLTALNVSYSWLARRVRRLAVGHGPTLLFLTATVLWMMNGASGSIEAPMSEYPTWMLVPVIGGLLFLGDGVKDWVVGGALIGLAALTRFNQLPAYAVLLLVFGLAPSAFRQPGWRDIASTVAVAAVLTFGLPLVHNYWYGHSLTILPTNRYSTEVIDLPLGSFFSTDHARVWALLLRKVEHLAHINADQASSWFVPLHLAQLGILFVAMSVWRGRLRLLPGHAWLFAAPAVALGIHLFYVVFVYYPRHIMFGYLLGGVVALVVIAEDGVIRGRPVER